MQWRGRQGSAHVEDRRGAGGGVIRLGGAGGLGLVAVVLVGWFFGVDLTPLLQQGDTSLPGESGRSLTSEEQAAGDFASVTLADTEAVWTDLLAARGVRYTPATMVLFSGVTSSPCGNASGATGPFYCPEDGKIYLDTAFFTTLAHSLGAGGDFAAAYVVAHEVAHHVQDQLGILSKVNDLRARASEAQSNALSVRIELQADCLSGVWAKGAEAQLGTLEPGDIDEALNAAAMIGDDTLMRQAGRVPMPERFTHGTAAQRHDWFARGYRSGSPDSCDTFGAGQL